jgi:mannose-6-phosphate isomerase-like protein (cupin superfamily)
MLGGGFAAPINESERADLAGLSRGVFLRHDVKGSVALTDADVFFAIPLSEGQVRANDWSKYRSFVPQTMVNKSAPLMLGGTTMEDRNEQLWNAVRSVRVVLDSSGVMFPQSQLEISHHYGIDRFDEYGLAMVTVVNRDYCKKLLIQTPGQEHPEQYHKRKEETFHVLFGQVDLWLDGVQSILRPGDVLTIRPGVRHRFRSPLGAVIEEISSTHFKDDSYYVDESIMENTDRKSFVRFWGPEHLS